MKKWLKIERENQKNNANSDDSGGEGDGSYNDYGFFSPK